MRKIIIITLLVLTGWAFLQMGCYQTKKIDAVTQLRQWCNLQIDSLTHSLESFDVVLTEQAGLDSLQASFSSSRLYYKRVEPVLEYYFQGLTKRINGPALPDIKTDDNQVLPPHGFQVIEQFLWSGAVTDSVREALHQEIKILLADLRFARSNLAEQALLPRHIREMIQHQLIRIAVLGITGFDAPLSQRSLGESKEALFGLKELCRISASLSKEGALPKEASQLFTQCEQYLQVHTDFNTFDRLQFIREHLAPLSGSLRYFPLPPDETDRQFTRPFTGTLQDLVRGEGFNPDYYASYASSVSNAAKVELGAALFEDRQLSSSGKISCASCHQPGKYFTDGLQKANNFVHGGSLSRNTPTIYYSSLQASQFYDMRSTTIEDQVNEVMQSSDEFNLQASWVAALLSRNNRYMELVQRAFGSDTLGGYGVRNAIAAFIRSKNPFSSRFDEFMRGNSDALNETEKKGFNLFTGKAKCATCHFVPVFNGTVPPWLVKSESEVIGVPAAPVWVSARIDADPGRYRLNQLEPLQFAFKTPTVRNIAHTAPYMHNGVYKSLEEVVEFYHRGGGQGLGINLPYQTLPFDSLQLNSEEKKAIIHFMKALSDKNK